MNILSGLFGGGDQKNPMDQANKYLDQIPGIAHQGFDPYINAGLDASGRTKSEYDSLINDPTGFINKLMESYKTSDGYNFQKDLLGREMSNTAAAGGIAGTPLDQMNQAQGVQGLLSKDMQQYLQNALGVYGTGLNGEEGIAGRGFDASKYLTDALGGSLNQKAGLEFQNAQQNNSNSNAWYQTLVKALGLGAGVFFGGPTGAVAGAAAGSRLANGLLGS